MAQRTTFAALAVCVAGVACTTQAPATNSSDQTSLRVVTIKDFKLGKRSWDESTTYTGAIVGGVVGGIIGNQMGAGNGKKAMTAIGAVAGAGLGNETAKILSHREVLTITFTLIDGRGEFQLTQDYTSASKAALDDCEIGQKARLRGDSTGREAIDSCFGQ